MDTPGDVPASFLVDPASLHILLVDANAASRANITALLQKYNYQVTSCKTSQEAIRTLEARRGPGGTSGFDLILKEHSPAQGTNACRLLRKAQSESVLEGIPIIVVSTTENRDVMVTCLQLGAADYMIKPLRHNEVRNLWARVYWWRRASYLQQRPSGSVPLEDFAPQPSNGSQETKEDDDGQEGLEEDSGEGSAPNGSASPRNGSNDGSKELGSKNGSKGANGWSGTQPPQPVFRGQAGGRTNGGNGTSTTNLACQGSNHPNSDAAPAGVHGGGNAPGATAVADAPALHIAPLDLSTKPSKSKQPVPLQPANTEPNRDSGDAAPGFRAYVSSENTRKRSADKMDNADIGTARSSGSDHTRSRGNPNSSKRRASVSRMDSGSAGVATSDATFNLAGDCTPAGGSQPAGPEVGGSHVGAADPMKLHTNHGQSGSGSCVAMNQGAANGFGGYYPFGMMTPFTVPPQFWSQMSGGQMGAQGGNADMAAMFSQFSHQAQTQQGMTNMSQGQQQQQQQHQQVAMHNQLMMQHSMLMQQCGMPAPPFVSFQNLNRAMANQASNSHQAGQPQQGGQQTGNAQPQRTPTPVHGQTQPHGAQGGPSGSAQETPSREVGRRGTPHTWSSGLPREHSVPVSGMFTGTGNGTSNGGNTLGSAPGNATGATSHTSAQLGMDGSLTEPSRQERRAQALHKYKQKRKNLNFTKKIRYESRKQLAQARPRVKGQFVRLQPGEEETSDPLAMELEEEASQMVSQVEEPRVAVEKITGEARLPSKPVVPALPTEVLPRQSIDDSGSVPVAQMAPTEGSNTPLAPRPLEKQPQGRPAATGTVETQLQGGPAAPGTVETQPKGPSADPLPVETQPKGRSADPGPGEARPRGQPAAPARAPASALAGPPKMSSLMSAARHQAVGGSEKILPSDLRRMFLQP